MENRTLAGPTKSKAVKLDAYGMTVKTRPFRGGGIVQALFRLPMGLQIFDESSQLVVDLRGRESRPAKIHPPGLDLGTLAGPNDEPCTVARSVIDAYPNVVHRTGLPGPGYSRHCVTALSCPGFL